MKYRLLPLMLLAVFGLAVAAGPDYPLDAPAPDGRRPVAAEAPNLPSSVSVLR